jgi:hypothetical protein
MPRSVHPSSKVTHLRVVSSGPAGQRASGPAPTALDATQFDIEQGDVSVVANATTTYLEAWPTPSTAYALCSNEKGHQQVRHWPV